jgi:hypothetical protein
MSSGESLDPRVVEAALDQCPAIGRSCVLGNNFLKAASQVVCAIIEPSRDPKKSLEARLPEITRAIATANRSLAPPLRISWARVLVLKEGQEVPITKKGAIFRKKLEQLFGKQLSTLLNPSKDSVSPQSESNAESSPNKAQGRTRDQISSIVANIVFETLKISEDTLDNNSQATFAEVRNDGDKTMIDMNNLYISARNGFRNVNYDCQQAEPSTRSFSASQYLPHLRRLGPINEGHLV